MPDESFVRHRCVNLLSDLFVNRNLLAILILALELYLAGYESEQGVVLTLTNIGAGMDLSSALSDEDISGQDELTVCSFDTKTLRLTVAAVLGRTHTFFMCH